jgi:general secretion pathway protein G
MTQTKQKVSKRNRWGTSSSAGMTLLELIVACGILVTMAGMAVPMARVTIKRQREAVLRYDLREMRDAIDRYKDAADHNLIRVEVGTEGYPPDLQTLVDGIQLAGAPDRHVRFLRSIPVDPMTGTKDWGMRSVQDDADADSWGGQDVFDVFTRSQGVALDGTNYKDW